MNPKVHEAADRIFRPTLFIPDVAGPRALPTIAAPSQLAGRGCGDAGCPGCFTCRLMRWFR